QGDAREHLRRIAASGATGVPVRREIELESVDGLILPGGESTTIAKLLTRFELMEPLRKHIGSGLAVYGSCAGMILLADRLLDAPSDQRTLGGLDVTVRRNAFGRQVDSFEGDLDFPAVGDRPMHAVFIRAPWVEQAGPGVQTLASIPSGPAAGRIVAVRQGVLLATAFHPEMTGDTRVHELFVRIVRAA
ncbi:MAG: pyridoxal 5'-phosphate synthase glutaminase subunit PdxT, partial [Geodermatophilaceae bacterium]|nr:pyridoxal 5'-phosphate synthase glutaminase subunit PdxT [Geodermatophilaceae bacterium]